MIDMRGTYRSFLCLLGLHRWRWMLVPARFSTDLDLSLVEPGTACAHCGKVRR